MKPLLCALFFFNVYAGIEDHYRKLDRKAESIGPRNIDFIYLINLDQRPERWDHSIQELSMHGIYPVRFPGIYGWTLPLNVLNDISVKFQPGMWRGNECVMVYPENKQGAPEFIYLNESHYGVACFSGWTVKGTIGCTLAHLSAIYDGYTSGHETIWILEDDITVLDDPHQLSDLIDELDALVGTDGWDVLYTDFDFCNTDERKDLASQLPFMWRPDMPNLDLQCLTERTILNEHFTKIGSRSRAHSIIYRRRGMRKILDFYRAHNNFLPYDQELPLIPGIKLFVLNKAIVSVHEVTSDTRNRYFY